MSIKQIENNLEQLLNSFYKWTRQLITNPESIRHDKINTLQEHSDLYIKTIYRKREKVVVNWKRKSYNRSNRIDVDIHRRSGRTTFSIEKNRVKLTFSSLNFFGIKVLSAYTNDFYIEKDYLTNVKIDYVSLMNGINIFFRDKKVTLSTPEGIFIAQEANKKGHMSTDKKKFIIELFAPLL